MCFPYFSSSFGCWFLKMTGIFKSLLLIWNCVWFQCLNNIVSGSRIQNSQLFPSLLRRYSFPATADDKMGPGMFIVSDVFLSIIVCSLVGWLWLCLLGLLGVYLIRRFLCFLTRINSISESILFLASILLLPVKVLLDSSWTFSFHLSYLSPLYYFPITVHLRDLWVVVQRHSISFPVLFDVLSID